MKARTIRDLADLSRFAEAFLSAHPRGIAVGLTGDVGAGKTTFVRACVEILCRRAGTAAPRVTSPSFVIQQSYRQLTPPLEHFDLYRLERVGFEQLVDMGYFEALEEARTRRGFVFVEWPERAGTQLLQLDESLHFAIGDGTRRTITAKKKAEPP